MTTPSTSEIRERFLAFFEERGHRRVRSSSVVPWSDPTLLFTNAGMNQFKDVFLGREQREYNRAVSAQKCLRAGGKHNDLEVVGFTGRHHTFFEMLGNFSFGDYFKEEAILCGWEFLTKVMGLSEQRLWVSVFREDDEAARIWTDVVGVAPDRVVRLGEKDNFWQMGDTGPCGPCSEIHYDQGDQVPCFEKECLGVECDCDRIVEIWNLVFMQYDRDAKGELHPLPAPSIDTGMGLERLAAVVQGGKSNYDIDLFRDIIAIVESLSQKAYSGASEDDAVSMRVLADHARATAFLVADGVLPASDGRGYVLRRIVRRAIRHGKRLGLEGLFFARVCERVVEVMGEAYPELVEQRALLSKVAEQEETSFRRTLDRGLGLLDGALEELPPGEPLPGSLAFKLYDTYGFPIDLTEVICQERGRAVDVEGFSGLLERQRAASAWAGSGEEAVVESVKKLSELHGPTDFAGYEELDSEGRVIAILRGQEIVSSLSEGEAGEIVLDRTALYGESGGQQGDAGLLIGDEIAFKVTDTKKVAGVHLHKGVLEQGELTLDTVLKATVDAERRRRVEANHSATHMLHSALREVLGEHVKQAGSLVAPDHLRFDYTTFESPADEQLEEVERRVNEMVWSNIPTTAENMRYDAAREEGAIAIFGEKYGDEVRVVRIAGHTVELCGGTHVRRAGDVGIFRIVSDSSISAGVRRITAVTREGALERAREDARRVAELSRILKSPAEDIDRKVLQLQHRARDLEREVERLGQQLATARAGDVMAGVREVNGIRVLSLKTEANDARSLRDLADRLRDRIGEGLVVLGAEKDGKAILLAAVTSSLIDRVRACDIVREIAPIVGGRGGGKADMAQAGGDAPERLDAALARVYEIVPSV